MNISIILDAVEQQVQDRATRRSPVDRMILLAWLEQELNTLAGMYEFDFLVKRVDPLILTTTGKRNYPLPEDFPENFIQGGDDGHRLCKINDGSREAFLDYKPPAEYFSRTIEDEPNAKPKDYTIMTQAGGAKEIFLGPPPDSNSDLNYTIIGLYRPTHWTLDKQDEIPPIPANAAVLRFALLRRIQPENPLWHQEYERHLRHLVFRASASKKHLMQPMMGSDNAWNSYEILNS